MALKHFAFLIGITLIGIGNPVPDGRAPGSYVLDLIESTDVVTIELNEAEESPEKDVESDPLDGTPTRSESDNLPDNGSLHRLESESETPDTDSVTPDAHRETLDPSTPADVEPLTGDVEEYFLIEGIAAPASYTDADPISLDSGISLESGFTLTSEPLETELFYVAGVTWEGTAPDQVEIRTLSSGELGAWYSLEIESQVTGLAGTEPYVDGGANGIQIRATGQEVPQSFDLHLMTGAGNSDEAQASEPEIAEIAPDESDSAPAVNAASSVESDDFRSSIVSSAAINPAALRSQLPHVSNGFVIDSATFTPNLTANKSLPYNGTSIIPRKKWGAPDSTIWPTQYAPLKGAVIHHTATSNSYTAAQSPAIVRSIWSGADVSVHDPMYSDEELKALGFTPYSFGTPADAAILQADHAIYKDLTPEDLPGIRTLVDGRNIVNQAPWMDLSVKVIGRSE